MKTIHSIFGEFVMKTWLYQIRTPRDLPLSRRTVNSVLVLFAGAVLGIFSKWLDVLSINDAVWWRRLLGVLDLRNVFSELAVWLLLALAISVYSATPLRAGLNVFLFLAGMCVSYHAYTVVFAGFNPSRYMLIWYGLTLFSPVFAAICWFGKGKTNLSLILDVLILGVMTLACFSVGLRYFSVPRAVNLLFWIGAVAVLYSTPKRTAISVLGALALAFVSSAWI